MLKMIEGTEFRKNGRRHAEFRCECGRTVKIMTKRANYDCFTCKECGVEKRLKKVRKHGMCGTSIYMTWQGMKARCLNEKAEGYRHYGGRGITVCKRWLLFKNFYADMGEKPSEEYTLHRVNNDGNYCPENCVWATNEVQQKNKSNSKIVTFRGEKIHIMDLAEKFNMPVHALDDRLTRGWDIEDAVSKPVVKKKFIKHNGEYKKLIEWSKIIGFDYKLVYDRIYCRHWSFEKAISTPKKNTGVHRNAG